MRKYGIVLIFLLVSVNTFAQFDWHFETKIEKNNHYLLEGDIAGKYPITMYLEYDDFCLYDNKWNYARTLKGWYYYNNRKIKLPLIGSEKYYETNSRQECKVMLYVPTDIKDNIRENTCDLEKFNEVFITDTLDEDGACSFESMQWKTNSSSYFLPVKFKKTRQPSPETEAFISLYIRGIEMLSFNLTANLRDVKDTYGNYIHQVDIEASKEVNNDFYLIFSFSIPSVPGGFGMGYCGAGFEDYLGFLHIGSFGVKEFKYYQTASCIRSFDEKYTYDKDEPEKGITMKK
jgi:hypothetical protein